MKPNIQDLIADIEAKAEKATPGPWFFKRNSDTRRAWIHQHKEVFVCEVYYHSIHDDPNGKYITSANPEAMKQIIAYIRKLEARVEAADDFANIFSEAMPTYRFPDSTLAFLREPFTKLKKYRQIWEGE